ncbi:MAG: dTDP-4-dehydrorhamnose 3,5-epimerase [Bacteroidia bacterium]
MEIINTSIPEVKIFKPAVFEDERGHFFESYREDVFSQLGLSLDFVQDNQSKSAKGIIRGLHFQANPFAQGKLVRVVKGAVLDVAVDIRLSSPTYGQSVVQRLDEYNKLLFWVPPGFAHGFLTLEDDTIFSYKCTQYYNRDAEGAILWNSSTLDIPWGIENPILSEKDRIAPKFADFKSPFQ